jgi:hypothetical protein
VPVRCGRNPRRYRIPANPNQIFTAAATLKQRPPHTHSSYIVVSNIHDGDKNFRISPSTMSATPLVQSPLKKDRGDSDAASQYTLRTVHIESDSEELTATIVHPLLSSHSRSDSNLLPTYGTLPSSNPPPSYFTLQRRRPLLTAAIKCAATFIVSSLLLGGTLWLALPRIEE